MGIYDFNSLPERDKYDTVFTLGQYVDNVSEKNIKYVLYSLSNFWVEVKYHPLDNKIIGIRSFIAGETLNRYSNVPDII